MDDSPATQAPKGARRPFPPRPNNTPSLPEPSLLLARFLNPREEASYYNRLNCFLMNYLQGDLEMNEENSQEGVIFNTDVPENGLLIHLMNAAITEDFIYDHDLYVMLGIHGVKTMHFGITAFKTRLSSGTSRYRLSAELRVYDESGDLIQFERSGNEKPLKAVIITTQYVPPPDANTAPLDYMSFKDVLNWLRHTCFLWYDEFGEDRTNPDVQQCYRTVGHVFSDTEVMHSHSVGQNQLRSIIAGRGRPVVPVTLLVIA